MKKQFRGTCGENPFNNVNTQNKVLDMAKEISAKSFLKEVDIKDFNIYGQPMLNELRKFPRDFTFFKYKDIYFFEHSRIDYFFF